MTIRRLAKRTGITILVSGLFLLTFHLVIKWRTRQILDFVIKEASGGQYKSQSEKVVIHYYPLRLEASRIILKPVDSSGRDYYSATADTFFLEIGHVWSLIRRKNFTIRKVSVNNLQVQVLTSARKNQNKSFHLALRDIQDAIVNSLTALKVEECKIRDAGISYARRDQQDQPLLINHINLDIDSLVAERIINPYETKASIKAQVRLLIDKPYVQLPDTSIHVGVDNLWLNTRENKFTVNSVRITYGNNSGTHDSITLSNMNLHQFNWLRYLENGELEIGTLLANNGEVSVDFSDRRLSEIAKKKDSSKEKKLLPIYIHDVGINKIQYNVRSKIGNVPFNTQLDGDSLSIENIRFNSDAVHPITLDNLAFKVSNYINKRDDKQNTSRFERLTISHNKLELRNYYRALDGAQFGSNNSIFIPVLTVEDFSLPALLEEHSLHARKLFLDKPELVIDIKRSKKQKDADVTIARIMDTLRHNLNISSISIRDASITLIPQEKTSGNIIIENLSTEIDAHKLLAANSVMQMIESATALSTAGFKLSSDNVRLEILRSSVSKGLEGIYLQRIKGDIDQKIDLDLYGVNISDKSNRFDVTKLHTIHLDHLSIDSGNLVIFADRQVEKKPGAKSAPVFILDQVSLGNTRLQVYQTDKQLDIRHVNLDGSNIRFDKGVGSWTSLAMKSGKLDWVTPNYSVNAGALKISQPGTIQASELRFIPSGNTPFKKLEIPLLTLKTNIPGTVITENKADYVTIENPVIDMEIGGAAGEPARALNIPDIELGKLSIINPRLNIVLPASKQHVQFTGDSGRIILSSILGSALENKLTVGNLDLSLASPKIDLDSSSWRPAELQVKGHDLALQANPNVFSAYIDTAQVLRMPVTLEKANVAVKDARAGIAGFQYKSTDSISFNSIVRTGNWWAGAASIAQLGKYSKIDVYNPLVTAQPEMITIDSLHMRPLLDREPFWDQFDYEKAFLDLRTGPVRLYDYDLQGTGDDRLFTSRYMEVENAELYVAKDKTRGPDSVKYRPLLAQMIEQIPMHFDIDSVQIMNGFVRSNVISIKTKKEGTIYFTGINGEVNHLKNYGISPADSLQFTLSSRIMGQGDLLVHFRQSYLDTNQTFRLEAKMGRLDLSSLNTMLLPLASLQIDRGYAESMTMNILGNDEDAHGFMNMRYRNLRVSWHRGGKTEFFLSRFFNWLINVVINTNSKEKSKLLYLKRQQDKAIFTFWGRLAVRGLLTNIGIRLNKKEVRKYRKAIKAGKANDFDEIL